MSIKSQIYFNIYKYASAVLFTMAVWHFILWMCCIAFLHGREPQMQTLGVVLLSSSQPVYARVHWLYPYTSFYPLGSHVNELVYLLVFLQKQVWFCIHVFLMSKNDCVNVSFGLCFFPHQALCLVHKLAPVPEEEGEAEGRGRSVQVGRWQV